MIELLFDVLLGNTLMFTAFLVYFVSKNIGVQVTDLTPVLHVMYIASYLISHTKG